MFHMTGVAREKGGSGNERRANETRRMAGWPFSGRLLTARLTAAMLLGALFHSAPEAPLAAGANARIADAAATPTLTCAAPQAIPGAQSSKTRIGVYDSRAIVVAFAGSALFNKQMQALMDDYKKAKASNDSKRIKEIETQGAARQKLFHKQGFSTAPVDDILETIKGDLPAIQKKASVSALVSKWDAKALAQHSPAEQVDVTMMLVDAFHPSERQRKSALEIQKSKPISLEQADRIRD